MPSLACIICILVKEIGQLSCGASEISVNYYSFTMNMQHQTGIYIRKRYVKHKDVGFLFELVQFSIICQQISDSHLIRWGRRRGSYIAFEVFPKCSLQRDPDRERALQKWRLHHRRGGRRRKQESYMRSCNSSVPLLILMRYKFFLSFFIIYWWVLPSSSCRCVCWISIRNFLDRGSSIYDLTESLLKLNLQRWVN